MQIAPNQRALIDDQDVHILRTPAEVRRVVKYVVKNHERHAPLSPDEHPDDAGINRLA